MENVLLIFILYRENAEYSRVEWLYQLFSTAYQSLRNIFKSKSVDHLETKDYEMLWNHNNGTRCDSLLTDAGVFGFS